MEGENRTFYPQHILAVYLLPKQVFFTKFTNAVINRVVIISVLMILSLTAAAGHRFAGAVVADTSVVPTAKTGIAKKPSAATARAAGSGSSTVKKHAAGTKAGIKSAGKAGEEKSTNKPGAANSRAGHVSKGSVKSAAVKTAVAKPGTALTSAPGVTAATTTKKNPVAGKKPAALTSAEANRATAKALKAKSRKLRKGIGIELYPPLAFKYAILLDVPVEKVTDDRLLQVLDHWYGTRYRYGGETRRGIDCSAFTQAFMLSYFDYELPRTAGEQYAVCKHVKKRKLRQGDLVFFRTNGPKSGITHVGVYLVNNRFVHSATSTGVRISDLNDDYYKEKYAGAGRIR